VLLTGPRGSGKTSVAVAAGDGLTQRGIPHAVIDLDWLCWFEPTIDHDVIVSVMCANLADLARRYAEREITTLILARSVLDRSEVDRVRRAAGGNMVTLRLSVPDEEIAQRLALRGDDHDLSDAARIAAAQRALRLPAVRNHGRSAADTAAEVLARLGWIR
jgi:hypothetical protein